MKGIVISLLAMFVAAAAFAQTTPPPSYSIWDVQHRLSVGGRFYRSFDERPTVAGSYTSSWWAGIPVAYVLTGSKKADGSENRMPLSLIGALDVGLAGADSKRIRGYVGVTALFKGIE